MLDAGCGTGEHVLLAASAGLSVLGVDDNAHAIARERAKARSRRLEARFVVADATRLAALGERFGTVLDAGFFHTLDDVGRERYVGGLRAAVRPGGRVLILCLSDRPAPSGLGGYRRRTCTPGSPPAGRSSRSAGAILESNLRRGPAQAWFGSIRRSEAEGPREEADELARLDSNQD